MKINTWISKEKNSEDNLNNQNKFMETDFVLALKEKELETVELQTKIENTQTEREDLLNELVDVEYFCFFVFYILKKIIINYKI